MRYLVISALLACLSVSSFAREARPDKIVPLRDYAVVEAQFQNVHDLLKQSISTCDCEGGFDEQMRRYKEGLVRLRSDFIKERTSDYRKASHFKESTLTCTKKSSGGSKTCGPRCVDAPPGMVTTQAQSGTTENHTTKKRWPPDTLTPTKACVITKKSGKGKSTFHIFATFKYAEEHITKSANAEADRLMASLR